MKRDTERDKSFVRHYVDNGGNATAAARAVGISDVSASAIGYRLRKRLSTAIEKASRDEIYGYVVPAATQLFRLMKEAKSESVRLAASKDIPDRAGFKPIERQEVTVTELNKMTVQELRAELERLMN